MHQCDRCDESFVYPYGLKKHIANIHEGGARNHICEYIIAGLSNSKVSNLELNLKCSKALKILLLLF